MNNENRNKQNIYIKFGNLKILVLILILFIGSNAVNIHSKKSSGKYKPDWESLKKHNTPEWLRDAKFGIYFHWGVYCVPAYDNEWYSTSMFKEDHKVFKHHIKTYGHPGKFGYHDFIPIFKAENFDADEWAELFVKAGARYAGPVVEHADGFAMWDSDLTPWCAAKMGPKRDITAELEQAIKKRGMRFVSTFHHTWNQKFFPPVEGLPTSNPEYRLLYNGQMPREEFEDLWKAKFIEVVDKYKPDLIYFDTRLNEISAERRQTAITHYYNQALDWGRDVTVTYKSADLPIGVGVPDYEKGRLDFLSENAWLTDDTVSYGSWCYTEDLKIKPVHNILHTLIDIVSKNGQLLLNISPKADGTIPDNQRELLLGIGEWLGKFGKSIYETRPLGIFGEGPTRLKAGGHFVEILDYTPEDIRYTRKNDTVYAIQLGWPGSNKKILLKTFNKNIWDGDLKINDVKLLGSEDKIIWKHEADGLSITSPESPPDKSAIVYQIKISGASNPVRKILLPAFSANLIGKTIKINEKGENSDIAFWSNPEDYVWWSINIPKKGKYDIIGMFATGGGKSSLVIKSGDSTITSEIPETGNWGDYCKVSMGSLHFDKVGTYKIILEPGKLGVWYPVNVRRLEFTLNIEN